MAETTLSDTLLTPHQGQFLAHWLTLEGSAETTLSRAIASARVDLNPHQYARLPVRHADPEPWIGRSGWLAVVKLAISHSTEALFVVCCSLEP